MEDKCAQIIPPRLLAGFVKALEYSELVRAISMNGKKITRRNATCKRLAHHALFTHRIKPFNRC